MTVIKVPRPPKIAFNTNRRVSALLKNQMEHMQTAEFRLPSRQQTNIYINKIKTEGEAAEYIRQVTAILHPEGDMSVGLELAAMGEKKSARKKKRNVKPKPKKKSPRDKKR